jgi:hypothetical protein
MSKSSTITPHHLPRGTVIETSLYHQPREGEVGPQWHLGETPNPAQLTVDHILIVDGWTGRNYMVVTTTPRSDDTVGVDEMISFNIDHVNRVVKRGHKTVFKSHKKNNGPRKMPWASKREYTASDIRSLISFKLNQEHPLIQFDIESMFSIAAQCGVIRQNIDDPSQGKYHWYYTTNRRKFINWIKRNKNRFIYKAKTLAAMEEAAITEERRYLEEQWGLEYLQDNDEVAEPNDADNPPAYKYTPVTDYPENLGGPFFSVLEAQKTEVD